MYDGNQFVGGNRGLGFEAKNMVGKEIERRTKERDNIKNPEKILELSPVKQQTKSRSRSRSRERRSELVETRRLDDILEQKILQEELEAARLAGTILFIINQLKRMIKNNRGGSKSWLRGTKKLRRPRTDFSREKSRRILID